MYSPCGVPRDLAWRPCEKITQLVKRTNCESACGSTWLAHHVLSPTHISAIPRGAAHGSIAGSMPASSLLLVLLLLVHRLAAFKYAQMGAAPTEPPSKKKVDLYIKLLRS